jgi:hypothetical protein
VDTASKLAELDLKKKQEPKPAVVKPEVQAVEKEEAPPAAPPAADVPVEMNSDDADDKEKDKEEKRREPEKVNSRAAAFESSAVSIPSCRHYRL